MISIISILILSYLVGSIPSSIICGKIVKGIDIRKHGSGNAGATNVFRVLGWKAGIIVALFDVAKGTFATIIISKIRIGALPFDNVTVIQILAGIGAILGHTFTIFAGFKGGKGVGTGAGMIIGLYPIAFLICAAIFALILFTTGIVSISSMCATTCLPISLILMNMFSITVIDKAGIIFSIIIPLFIIYTHRSNVGRLFRGEENTFENLKLFRKKNKS